MVARATCGLMCDRAAKRMRCCGKRMCDPCFTKLVKINVGKDTWHLTCPFCRAEKRVTHKRVKALMHAHCPDHAQVVETVDVGPAAVVHWPGPDGHYRCPESSLEVLPLDMPAVIVEMSEIIEDLETSLAESERVRASREDENRRLRSTANV